MKPERWQQLDQLFHSALAVEPAERPAFLDAACLNDDSLRREVETLLKGHENASSFMSRPALEVEAELLAKQQAESAVGQTVGHYKVLSSLGVGGMGEVYLADDCNLGRKVALKLLPLSFTQDVDRIRRFQQEARAASALNHPNIITIYEIGQIDDRHFIATEFIDGQNLRQLITTSEVGSRSSGRQLKLGEILNVAIQIADALSAAHEAGIVHRDIKPENIMVRRRDRYVKVLDFGLAKLSESFARVDSESPTIAQVKTSAGVVMGTVGYMSPEQARAENIDARTDIWSLGVVLYEMVAGRAPFERSTPSEVIASILEHEPVPLPRYSRDVPAELERIVSKTLVKDREERYQTAKDLLVDLRRLKQRLEIETEIERTSRPGRSDKDQTKVTARALGAESGVYQVKDGMTSSDQYVATNVKGYRRILRIALPTLLVVGLLIVALYQFGWNVIRSTDLNPPESAAAFQNMKMLRFTNTGKVTDGAISPDGKYVVHLVVDGEQQSLWMKQVSSPTSEVRINAPSDLQYLGLTYSPTGDYLYFNAWDRKNPYALYRMSVLGGAATKLVSDIDSLVTFSPDNKRFAYFRGNPLQGELGLFVANIDGTEERKIATHKIPARASMNCAGWSPDGKKIVFAVDSADANASYVTLAEVLAEGGGERRITSRGWWRIDRLNWLSDGRGLIFIAREQMASPAQIWFLSYPDGQARQITNDLDDYLSLSLTADSASIVTVRSEQVSNLWVVPGNKVSNASQISSSRFDGTEGISWTSDNRIIYASRGSDRLDLWIVDSSGKNRKQLTTDAGNNKRPSVSPDGRYVVFVSDRTGTDHIWRIDIDGSNPKQLTNSIGEKNPQCSPDGNWVVYQLAFGKTGVWRVPFNGGEPKQLVDKPTRGIAVSPDSKRIATSYFERAAIKTAIYSFDGGEPLKILDVSAIYFRWTLDGRALAYVDLRNSQSVISTQSIDGGPPKTLIDLTPDRIFYFAWSDDQKTLAVARGSVTQDVVLISDLKNKK